jgi:hypothetical protein
MSTKERKERQIKELEWEQTIDIVLSSYINLKSDGGGGGGGGGGAIDGGLTKGGGRKEATGEGEGCTGMEGGEIGMERGGGGRGNGAVPGYGGYPPCMKGAPGLNCGA